MFGNAPDKRERFYWSGDDHFLPGFEPKSHVNRDLRQAIQARIMGGVGRRVSELLVHEVSREN